MEGDALAFDLGGRIAKAVVADGSHAIRSSILTRKIATELLYQSPAILLAAMSEMEIDHVCGRIRMSLVADGIALVASGLGTILVRQLLIVGAVVFSSDFPPWRLFSLELSLCVAREIEPSLPPQSTRDLNAHH